MMKITIEYSNKIYNFEHGYETYIFCAAVNNEFDKTHPDELKDFIFLVGECYLKDSNQTPLGALSDYIAENWDKIKHLSRYDILEKFYDQLDYTLFNVAELSPLSSSVSTTAICPFSQVLCLRISTKSPSSIPAFIIDSPLATNKKYSPLPK